MLFLHDCAVYQAKFLFSSSRQIVKIRPENPVANEKTNLKIIMSFSQMLIFPKSYFLQIELGFGCCCFIIIVVVVIFMYIFLVLFSVLLFCCCCCRWFCFVFFFFTANEKCLIPQLLISSLQKFVQKPFATSSLENVLGAAFVNELVSMLF